MQKTIATLKRELEDLSGQIVETDGDLGGLRGLRGELMRQAVAAGVRKNVIAFWAGVDPVVVSRALKEDR